jgi:hypothetical protein
MAIRDDGQGCAVAGFKDKPILGLTTKLREFASRL